MDQTFQESIKVEPEKLLEQFWFFSNVMSKNSGKLYQETFKLIEKGTGEDLDKDDKLKPKNEENSQDEELESEISLGNLIRQASLSNSEICFRSHEDKTCLTARSRITKLELGEKVGGSQGPTSQQVKTQKSLHDLEELYKLELQVFKDPGLCSDAQTSATKDIKAHIKFWARTVASSARG